MAFLRLLMRLIRLPFDILFLSVDLVRVVVYYAMGMFWVLTGNERPPFGPCAHGAIVEVEGGELARCPLGAKYGNPFLARLLCAGVSADERAAGVAICGCEGSLRSGWLRMLLAGFLLLLFWGAVIGGVVYSLVLRHGAPPAPEAVAEAVPGGEEALTPEARREQAKEWALKGEKALQAGDAAAARLALAKATGLDATNAAAFTALGRACVALEMFNDAGRAFEAALALDPKDADALLAAAALARDTGNLQRALAYATRAVALAPDGFEANLALVRAQRLNRDMEAAAQGTARLMQLAPADARAPLEAAIVALGRKALDEAERSFRRSIDLDPTLVEARIGLAQVLAERGDRAAAREHLEALASQYPADPTPRIELAEMALRDGRTAEAIRLYGEITAAFPRRFLLRARHGELLAAHGKVDEAYRVLQDLLRDNPGDAMAHLVLADMFLRRGFLSLADEHVTQALAQSPRDPQAYRLRARIAVAQGNLAAGIRILRVLLEVMPQDAELRARLAQCLEQTGELDEAEKEIQRAITLRPEMAGLHAQLGQLLARRNRSAEAAAAYRVAIQRDPQNVAALNNLAMLLLEPGKPSAEARGFAERARAAAPGSPQAADTLAWCALLEGNLNEAEALSAEAARTLGDNAVVRLHRGMVLKAQGRTAEAVKELQEALRLGLPTPREAEAKALLEALKKP